MNRTHLPCSACARYAPNPGHCSGFDRPAQADDQPCVLFVERGTWAERKQQRNETISRASA